MSAGSINIVMLESRMDSQIFVETLSAAFITTSAGFLRGGEVLSYADSRPPSPLRRMAENSLPFPPYTAGVLEPGIDLAEYKSLP